MPSLTTLVDRRGGKRLVRLLALLLALAVASPVLLADDRGHDQDRDHGRFVDPIVGSWIIHITVDTFTPTPTDTSLPLKFDNLTAFWEDGITTSSDPTQGTSYGVWEKVAPRTYRPKLLQVNADGTIRTVLGGPLVLNPQGDQMSGPFHAFITGQNGQVIAQLSGTVVFNRITFTSQP